MVLFRVLQRKYIKHLYERRVAVRCPACGAAPGQPCRSRGRTWRNNVHADRSVAEKSERMRLARAREKPTI